MGRTTNNNYSKLFGEEKTADKTIRKIFNQEYKGEVSMSEEDESTIAVALKEVGAWMESKKLAHGFFSYFKNHEARSSLFYKNMTRARLSTKLRSYLEDGKLGTAESYPFLSNFFLNIYHKIFVMKDRTKESINSPWRIVDGLNFFFATNQKNMPYNWASSLKIIDAKGHDVCLLHHNKRHLAKLIVSAPEIYKFIIWSFINSDEVFHPSFVQSEQGQIYLESLKKIATALFLSYSYEVEGIDPELILAIAAKEFILSLCNNLQNINEDEIRNFTAGKPSTFENDFWYCLEKSFNASMSMAKKNYDIKNIEVIASCSKAICSGLANNLEELDESVVRKLISTSLRVNFNTSDFRYEYREKGIEEDEPVYYPIYSLAYLANLFNMGEMINPDVNPEMTEAMIESGKKEITANSDEDIRLNKVLKNREKLKQIDVLQLDIFLNKIGVKPSIIRAMPQEIKEEVIVNMSEILYGDEENKKYRSIIATLSKAYMKYEDYLQSDNFNIMEAEREIRTRMRRYLEGEASMAADEDLEWDEVEGDEEEN